MENFTKLLKTENSELSRLLQFSLYGIEAALKQALTKYPNDPGADLCQAALQELNTLLQPASEIISVDNSDLADILQIAPDPIQNRELKLGRLQNEFNSDKQLALYLGDTQLQSQTDYDLWNEIHRKLLRVPEDLAVSWRQRALVIAKEVGAQEDTSNCLSLPFNKHENIYPGLKGSITVQGLCFSNVAQNHPQIDQLNLNNYQVNFQEDIYFLANLVSSCIKFIDIEPDLHHALKNIFSFDIMNLYSKPEHRCQYTDALIESFWRMLKAEESADSLSALRHWIDLDEAIHSLVFVPPADRFSWWGKLQQETRRLLKKVVQRAVSEGHNIRIRQLSGLYADVCAYSKDDLRLEIGGNPGEVLSCLRVYAKINEQEFPGRVLFRSSR
ncbi:hypothetical protein NIES4071_23620 [Calothrix sp. NIES-4071]|nr:hypothetical protein NIES4071_23620 [Calothrix sp. NIES-4071]BAZ56686.1 hypothetical protein NIES4105_23570 [Calothrix sp. NIES-4105]